MVGYCSRKVRPANLAQSLAREFGPQGVHVAHAINDGGIDVPDSSHYPSNDGTPDGKISPYAVYDNSIDIAGWYWIANFIVDCRELLVPTYATQICFHTGNRFETLY